MCTQGVSTLVHAGICVPRGCLPQCMLKYVYPGGCLTHCMLGYVYPGGRVPQCMLGYTPCQQNDRQTGVKTLTCHNYVVDGNKQDVCQTCTSWSALGLGREAVSVLVTLSRRHLVTTVVVVAICRLEEVVWGIWSWTGAGCRINRQEAFLGNSICDTIIL